MSSAVMIHRRGRLEMYCRGADTPEYWEDHWKQHPPQMMTGMGVYVGFRWAIERYMPREGLIVEAGCGNGNTARTIRAAGYDIECLDFAPKVIAANLAIDPAGRYRVGDVREMPYSSGVLAGYISLGVVEHFDDVTRRQILREAARCLMPGATALITVPHYNMLRRARFGLLGRGTIPTDLALYQYFFSRREIEAEVRAVGLEIVASDGYDAYKGIKDTIGGKGLLDRMRSGSRHMGRLVDHPPSIVRRACGHMLLIVARKPACLDISLKSAA
ncbi:MAG: class I SAM-dependent methyltransferase [Phycisphaeraceae bacterium]|nr:class I SAM-dependent methyltransferase [Phycisphaeraceae bacterium]MCW5763700.1 class I SAM-dependent methyltransferase [Phycisphaeraceae bacterium]